MRPQPDLQRIIACRGDEEPLIERASDGTICLLSDIEVYGRAGTPTRELKAGGDPDTNAHRLEMIQSLMDGKHHELVVKRALAYRQKKGVRNRRGLRFALSALDAIAPTFKGQPFLVDHDTLTQTSRKGTIISSESAQDSKGYTAFYMGLSVVKPDAAISILDGTIDRFSIGWFVTGPVNCTVHGCDVRGKDSCYCWPLAEVEVDGATKIAEYEYQQATGKELSAVNVPAVIGTRIEEFQAALSAELQLPTRTTKERTMAGFPRLAAALSLSALAEEAHEGLAVTAVQALRESALNAQIEAREAKAALTELSTQLAAANKRCETLSAGAFDRVIEDAYADGKLGYGKDGAGKNTPDVLEEMLREHGAAKGIESLKAKIAAMKVVIPAGQRLQVSGVAEPAKLRAVPSAEVGSDEEFAGPDDQRVADALGIKVEDMRKFRKSQGGK